ncbi:ABC transporter substrate-binding protein [Rhizobium sp. L1K21]|uniref:ABC transporter substrate-binding protein n=1 Tax=Rhizobium sp. L1K21 TaxID=2954933 RepID=UPI0020939D0C|nr:ABC transporter substrate-binding protein [Rhizobium sp. L1K21]MCO6187590.1 ABC transporter substrate-binding protein [Rhizobium sp. L1K21]
MRFSGVRGIVQAMVMAGVATLSLAGGASADDLPVVRVERSPVGQFEGLFIAEEQGLFAKHGVKVEIEVGASPDGALAQLMSGQKDVAMTGAVPLTAAVANGLPVVAVLNAQDQNEIPTFGLIVPQASDIKTIADLKGKKIGLPGIASPQGAALLRTLEAEGMTRDDVELVNLPFPGVLSAIESGSVDAGMPIGLFYDTAIQSGNRELKEVANNATLGFPSVIFASNREWAEANAETLGKFIAAMEEAYDYANANPDAVRAIDMAQTKLPPEYLKSRVISPFQAGFNSQAWDVENASLFKYGFIARAPSADEYLWSGAPRQ